MLIKYLIGIAIFGPLPSLSACAEPSANERFSESFFSAPSSSWREELAALPLDKQYEVYMWGVKNHHPPPLGLADAIADQGRQAALMVSEKMRATRDPAELSHAIIILSSMSTRDLYYPCDDPLIRRSIEAGLAIVRASTYDQFYTRNARKACSKL